MRPAPLILLALLVLAPLTAASHSARSGGFSSTQVYPGHWVTGFPSRTATNGTLGILPLEMTFLTSAHGNATIAIGVYRPEVPGWWKVPVIVRASPYFRANMSATLDRDGEHEMRVANFVPHGYAVAFVAVRGTSDSGGCADLNGPLERADLQQALSWLETRSWSSGNVGMLGVSYDAATAWEVASLGDSHVKTIVASSGWADHYEWAFNNGTSRGFGLGYNWLVYNYGYGAVFDYPRWTPWGPGTLESVSVNRSADHRAAALTCRQSPGALEAGLESSATGQRDAGGFWAARDWRQDVLDRYRGSVLITHGLNDLNVQPLQDLIFAKRLQDKGNPVKWILGQWGHQFPDGLPAEDPRDDNRRDWAEIELHWFNYWLKGQTWVDLAARAQLEDTTGSWRNEAAWPPGPQSSIPLMLGSGPAPVVVGQTDPTDTDLDYSTGIDGCTNCPILHGPTMPTGGILTGLPHVDIRITPLAGRLTIGARLYVDNGTALVRAGHGNLEITDAEPDVPMMASVWISPMEAVIPPGARLVLAVEGGGYVTQGTSIPFLVQPGTHDLHATVVHRTTFFASP